MKIIYINLLLLILSYSCSSTKNLETIETPLLLYGPILSYTVEDSHTTSKGNRILGVSEDKHSFVALEAELNYYYYKNLNRIVLVPDSIQGKIGNYLDLQAQDHSKWHHHWPENMTKEDAKKAKLAIGINFITPTLSSNNENQGFTPILNLSYFDSLDNYNYLADILEGYEMETLLKPRYFSTHEEARAWGLFQIFGLGTSYGYFYLNLKEEHDEILPTSKNIYIAGMNEETLLSYFESFKSEYEQLLRYNTFEKLIKVIQL